MGERQQRKSNLVEALPSKIIVEITSRLPIKSIISCMRICKLWRSLISNPFLLKYNPTYFMVYLEYSPRFAILDHHHHHDDDTPCFRFRKDQFHLTKPIFPPSRGGSERICTVVGSCNGLICFEHNLFVVHNDKVTNIYLYNPIIGESITIPKPTSTGNIPAFAFCPITNLYKLLRVVQYVGDDNREFEIYTLGTQKWRHIGKAPFRRCTPVCGEGVVHWLWSPENNQNAHKSIIMFNLATEEFGEAPPPPLGEDKIMYNLGYMDRFLIVTVGCLLFDPFVSGMDIWVRKGSSWTKDWVVRDQVSRLIMNQRLKCLVPIAISSDGVISLMHIRTLYCYDSKDKHTTAKRVALSWSGLISYNATLVSPRDLMKDVITVTQP